mmetsp:Transcript_41958/g.88086  ORF Transcript_41958/g.88086 Transcript_41958/m.88086 type:complete len:240 (-) Transcript_41958:478-1197(-)
MTHNITLDYALLPKVSVDGGDKNTWLVCINVTLSFRFKRTSINDTLYSTVLERLLCDGCVSQQAFRYSYLGECIQDSAIPHIIPKGQTSHFNFICSDNRVLGHAERKRMKLHIFNLLSQFHVNLPLHNSSASCHSSDVNSSQLLRHVTDSITRFLFLFQPTCLITLFDDLLHLCSDAFVQANLAFVHLGLFNFLPRQCCHVVHHLSGHCESCRVARNQMCGNKLLFLIRHECMQPPKQR